MTETQQDQDIFVWLVAFENTRRHYDGIDRFKSAQVAAVDEHTLVVLRKRVEQRDTYVELLTKLADAVRNERDTEAYQLARKAQQLLRSTP